MSIFFNGQGKFDGIRTTPIFSGSNYNKNLSPVVNEKFTEETDRFILTGCEVSDNGLVFSSTGTVKFNRGTAIDSHRVAISFKYVSGLSIGVALGETCALVSGSNLVIGVDYAGSTTAPTASTTQAITFTLTAGQEYLLSLEKEQTSCTATITNVKTNESVSASITDTVTLCLGAPSAVVFAGTNAVITNFSYFAALFDRCRCLIVGDSITEGVGVATNPTARCSYKLANEYFHGDCLISGVGWATTAGCKTRADELLLMGYDFDVIMFFSGTNDSNPTTATYQTIVAAYAAKGIKVIWGIPPMRNNREDAMAPIRAALLAVKNCGFLRFDYATADSSGNPAEGLWSDETHPNAAGHLKMYEYAVKELPALGV
jgi:lysophospholipase L1-like esterase